MKPIILVVLSLILSACTTDFGNKQIIVTSQTYRDCVTVSEIIHDSEFNQCRGDRTFCLLRAALKAQDVKANCIGLEDAPDNDQCEIVKNYGDIDCSDISTQNNAQEILRYTYFCFGKDRFDLDEDNDGVACENLPK